jgi:hypothetical protein
MSAFRRVRVAPFTPSVALRQWVLTVFRFRGPAKTAAVTVVQRPSSDMRLNPHLHVVFLDGAYHEQGGDLAWEELCHLKTREVGDVLEATVRRFERYLRRRSGPEPSSPSDSAETASLTYAHDLGVDVEAGDVGGGLGGARSLGVDAAERGPAGPLAEELDAARGGAIDVGERELGGERVQELVELVAEGAAVLSQHDGDALRGAAGDLLDFGEGRLRQALMQEREAARGSWVHRVPRSMTGAGVTTSKR